jgi:Raf kinase inhibitor-like YbhB/YbcL family protein
MPGPAEEYFHPADVEGCSSRTKIVCPSIVDPHPVAQNWVHWFVINLPPQVSSLEEGASKKKMPSGSVELKNSFGDAGYGGPQPPKGITLYALNVDKLNLNPDTSLAVFKKAIEGKVIMSASITGKYGR